MKNSFISFLNNLISYIKVFFFGLLIFYSCHPKSGDDEKDEFKSTSLEPQASSIRHSVGFDLIERDHYKLLHIYRHYNETIDTLSYVFSEDLKSIPAKFAKTIKIKIPAVNIALLHSSYVSYFNLCDAKSYIKAISETKYIYDEEIYSAVKAGEIREVGYGESLDKEQLLALNIDVVVTVGFPNTPNKSQQMLNELGIPVIVFSDWQENTLLGRTEWVKAIAALTGKDELAEEKFTEIERQYNSLKSLTANLAGRPKTICNLPYKGSWYVPGGNSYVSNVLKDAGADYLWSDNEGTGGVQLDFETVYAEGINAEFWINPDFAYSIRDVLDKDERLGDFNALQSGKVFNSINRITRGQANDYWESGIINPHLILADLIAIFHPDLLSDHQLFYYQQIF